VHTSNYFHVVTQLFLSDRHCWWSWFLFAWMPDISLFWSSAIHLGRQGRPCLDLQLGLQTGSLLTCTRLTAKAGMCLQMVERLPCKC
jgi:hypothetical protein